MTWKWPSWFRWTVRVLALIAITLGVLTLFMAAPVNSAGNTGIWFIAELEGFRGGPEDAYDRLCSSEQDRIGREHFFATGSAEYSVLANAGAVGATAEYPDDAQTLSSDIQEAWTEHEITTPDGEETWRLYLERGREWWEIKSNWTICGLEQR